MLGKYQAKATFFVVGEWVDKFPESVKALHDAGHSIQNHSNTHKHYPKLSRDEIIKDLNACNDKIEKVTGVRPTLARPPYGDYDNAVIEAVNAAKMTSVQWDVDSLDWKDLTASEMYQKVVPKVRNGSIILFHNAAKHTPEALPAIIEALQRMGISSSRWMSCSVRASIRSTTRGGNSPSRARRRKPNRPHKIGLPHRHFQKCVVAFQRQSFGADTQTYLRRKPRFLKVCMKPKQA